MQPCSLIVLRMAHSGFYLDHLNMRQWPTGPFLGRWLILYIYTSNGKRVCVCNALKIPLVGGLFTTPPAFMVGPVPNRLLPYMLLLFDIPRITAISPWVRLSQTSQNSNIHTCTAIHPVPGRIHRAWVLFRMGFISDS